MDRIGEYLLEEFYNNDLALYASTNPNKHASLRLLAERCGTIGLPVKRTFLSYSIRSAVILRQLPRNCRFRQLPQSHRVELLKVKSVERIEGLANRAINQTLTVDKLRGLVTKEVDRAKSTRGRKPLPDVVKAVCACVRLMRNDETGKLAFRREDITALTDEQMGDLVEHVEILSRRLEDLLKLIR